MQEYDLFISYSSKELDIAEEIKAILEKNGIHCWMAPSSIPIGADYAFEIPKGILNSKAFLIIVSDESQRSKWVPKELGHAITNGKYIFPLLINNTNISKSFGFFFENVQRFPVEEISQKGLKELIDTYRVVESKKFFAEPIETEDQVQILEPKDNLSELEIELLESDLESEKIIFINSTSKDLKKVLPILLKLKNEGYRFYYNENYTFKTRKEFDERLTTSNLVLNIVSNDSAKSDAFRNLLLNIKKKNKISINLYLDQDINNRYLKKQLSEYPSYLFSDHSEELLEDLIDAFDQRYYLKPNSHPNLKVIEGDLLDAETDAIINPANVALKLNYGLSATLSFEAGPQLQEACNKLSGVMPGNAVITDGFDLKAKKVIHAVGPRWTNRTNNKNILKNSYINALRIAEENELKTVGMPLISTGAKGCPLEVSFQTAVEVCNKFLNRNPDYNIDIYVLDREFLKEQI